MIKGLIIKYLLGLISITSKIVLKVTKKERNTVITLFFLVNKILISLLSFPIHPQKVLHFEGYF
jgi:hypothetical protein